MNLQTHIRPDLWLAIANIYQVKGYSNAILDAMHFLSDVLREKTGVDGDGATLVGQALGGDSPRLRINKLQTETERNIQKGLEQILRGLYLAIRNPRSHEQIDDTEDTADSIIYFINYILSILDKSEEPFILRKYLERVFDEDFVSDDRYAELLADEIPVNKRTETLIEIYRRRMEGDGDKLAYIVKAIICKLTNEQLTQFIAVISDDFKTIQDEDFIVLALQIIPPNLWLSISEVARLRIENKLLGSIKEGEVYLVIEEAKGVLGAWARRFLEFFTLKAKAYQILLDKLEDTDSDDRRYVMKFFLGVLPQTFTEKLQVSRLIEAISKAIRNGEWDVRKRLIDVIHNLPESWQKEFVENLKDLTDRDYPETYLTDGTPFLKGEIEGDEIPF